MNWKTYLKNHVDPNNNNNNNNKSLFFFLVKIWRVERFSATKTHFFFFNLSFFNLSFRWFFFKLKKVKLFHFSCFERILPLTETNRINWQWLMNSFSQPKHSFLEKKFCPPPIASVSYVPQHDKYCACINLYHSHHIHSGRATSMTFP